MKYLLCVRCALFCFLVPVFTLSCINPFVGSSGRTSERELTLLLYMSGDNDLASYIAEDLARLEGFDLRSRALSILALVDRPEGAMLYDLTYNAQGYSGQVQSPSIDSEILGLSADAPSKLNMGDAGTLKNFVREAVLSYPAQNYSIVIWGHGSGWRGQAEDGAASRQKLSAASQGPLANKSTLSSAGSRALAFDDSPNDALYSAELAEGLGELKAQTGKLWGLIAFELCNGMMFETLYELRELAVYAAGSSDLIPAAGWNYQVLGQGLATLNMASSLELAGLFADAFEQTYAQQDLATFSIVELARLEDVHDRWNTWADATSQWIASGADVQTRKARQSQVRNLLFSQVEDFYLTPGDLNIDMADALQVFLDSVPDLPAALENAASSALAAVNSAVLHNFTSTLGNPWSTGLAIHLLPLDTEGFALPPHDAGYLPNSGATYPLAFVQDSEWVPTGTDALAEGLLGVLWYRSFE